MIFAFLSSQSASWWLFETIFCLIAGVGGILVFWGLRVEGPPADAKGRRGWRILMTGIFIEIIVAVTFAARDGWQSKKLQLEEARIDPINQPIANISARVFLIQQGTNHTHVDPNKNEADTLFINLMFGHRAELTNGWPVGLDCITCKSSPMGTNTEWIAEFGPSVLKRFRSIMPTNSIVNDAATWDVAELDALFLPKDSVILEGHITILVNSFRREIPIPPQTVSSMSKVWPPAGTPDNFTGRATNDVLVVSW